MSKKHLDVRWQKLLREHKPRLIARLPHPCPRCGQVMERGMKLDMGHSTRAAQHTYDASLLRLEHRACNRRDGQRITTALRLSKDTGARMPKW